MKTPKKYLMTMYPILRYVRNHKILELDQEPNVEYLGHPINAFNLIKHTAVGWSYINDTVKQPLNRTLQNICKY